MNVKRISFLGIRARPAQGFTLIEILVASAVMALLVGLVITITSQVLNVWNRSGGRLSANQEARIALEFLTQDLETAIFRNNESQWMRTRKRRLETPIGNVPNTVDLRFFSTTLNRPMLETNGDRIPGDISAISYELDFVDPVTGGDSSVFRQFVLFRRTARPDDTFRIHMAPGDQGDLSDNDIWGVRKGDGEDNDFLVGNVIEFKVEFFLQGESEPIPFPDTDPMIPIPYFIWGGSDPTHGPGTLETRPVDRARITLRVLSSEGANIISGILQSGRSFPLAEQTQLLNQHSTLYIRKVSMKNRPF